MINQNKNCNSAKILIFDLEMNERIMLNVVTIANLIEAWLSLQTSSLYIASCNQI